MDSQKRYKILAIWWKGCKQPFNKWRKAVKYLYPKSVISYNKIYLWPKEDV